MFQNPDTSLNPRQTVGTILVAPMRWFASPRVNAEVAAEVDRLLDLVRLPRSYAQRYPHQLSGGEKQRVGIARALASRPEFLVCDEAVSALDVSVQAAVLNLLRDLRDELGVAYLFISHDIGVIAHIADRVAVMYRGSIVEEGPVDDVLHPPYHPYTELLLSSVPLIGKRRRRSRADARRAVDRSHGRLQIRRPLCAQDRPDLRQRHTALAAGRARPRHSLPHPPAAAGRGTALARLPAFVEEPTDDEPCLTFPNLVGGHLGGWRHRTPSTSR